MTCNEWVKSNIHYIVWVLEKNKINREFIFELIEEDSPNPSNITKAEKLFQATVLPTINKELFAFLQDNCMKIILMAKTYYIADDIFYKDAREVKRLLNK